MAEYREDGKKQIQTQNNNASITAFNWMHRQPIVECPNCGTSMEECEVDYESMSEGQMADSDSGFNHPFICPKCNTFFLTDVGHIDTTIPDKWDDTFVSRTDVNLSASYKKVGVSCKINITNKQQQAKENQDRGDWGEYLVTKHPSLKEYHVLKVVLHVGKKYVFNSEEVTRYCRIFHQTKALRYLKSLIKNQGVKGIPDFLAINAHECVYIESKSELEKIKPKQLEVHKKLKEKGFEVRVFCTHVRFPHVSWGATDIYAVS